MKVDVTVSCGDLKKGGTCGLTTDNDDCRLCCLLCAKRKTCPRECDKTQELFRTLSFNFKPLPETIRPIKEKHE